MFTVTFYSYKGGVGRTSALINTAVRLKSFGRRVFIIDFDLEAPGFHDFLRVDPTAHDGLLNYITDYTQTGSVPDLSSYVFEYQPGGESGNLFDRSPARGAIFVMLAGRKSAEYSGMLAKLNWKEFYSHQSGFLFVENLKAAIDSNYRPDYLLVDSRTGLTDVSGICTLQLPDLVVLLYSLNMQNLSGTSQIYDAVTRNTINRAISTLLVASPVPDIPEFMGLKQERLDKAKEIIGAKTDALLPFNPFVAFEERILPLASTDFLAKAYDELARKIVAQNSVDPSTLLLNARAQLEAGDVTAAERRYKELLEADSRHPDIWREYGNFLRITRRENEAILAFQKALECGAADSVRNELASTLLEAGRMKEAYEQLGKYLSSAQKLPDKLLSLAYTFQAKDQVDAAIETYKQVLSTASELPDRYNAAFEIGALFLRKHQAADSIEYLKIALSLAPSSLPATYNLGYAYKQVGDQDQAANWFDRAIRIFERTRGRELPSRRANVLQAMSHAYAHTGQTSRALELLHQALQISESLEESSIFSSVQYRDISAREFAEETKTLIHNYSASSPPGSVERSDNQ